MTILLTVTVPLKEQLSATASPDVAKSTDVNSTSEIWDHEWF